MTTRAASRRRAEFDVETPTMTSRAHHEPSWYTEGYRSTPMGWISHCVPDDKRGERVRRYRDTEPRGVVTHTESPS